MQAVLYDVDGVLADTVPMHYEACKIVADQLGVDFTKEDNQAWQGRSRTDLLSHLAALSPVPADVEQLGRVKDEHYQRLIAALTPLDQPAGVSAFLDTLQSEGVTQAAASSSRNAAFVLRRLGIDHYFHCIVTGRDVKNLKPHPEVFLRAAEAIQIPPQQCVVIEDSAAGVEAGRAAGMFTISCGPAAYGADDYVPVLNREAARRLLTKRRDSRER
ncbi:HAD family hydrolase [Alkalicoccus chagannorensis]|uniref:HAD family hydrolase n=1 Tax=Alkalicoccus chagannorensis TaxID=427072 RepID=UPI0004164E1A|nr:beta-phosphoglucomutase family hydrolase [Alkalicoccus chagannorensis]